MNRLSEWGTGKGLMYKYIHRHIIKNNLRDFLIGSRKTYARNSKVILSYWYNLVCIDENF